MKQKNKSTIDSNRFFLLPLLPLLLLFLIKVSLRECARHVCKNTPFSVPNGKWELVIMAMVPNEVHFGQILILGRKGI